MTKSKAIISEVKRITGISCSFLAFEFPNGMVMAITSVGTEDAHITFCDSIESLSFYAGENSTAETLKTQQWTAQEFIPLLAQWECQEHKKPSKKMMETVLQFAA